MSITALQEHIRKKRHRWRWALAGGEPASRPVVKRFTDLYGESIMAGRRHCAITAPN